MGNGIVKQIENQFSFRQENFAGKLMGKFFFTSFPAVDQLKVENFSFIFLSLFVEEKLRENFDEKISISPYNFHVIYDFVTHLAS